MVKFIIAGGMGAILNCVYSSAFSFDLLFRDFLVEPLSAIRTLLPAVFGFLFGTLVVLVWNFMRAMAVRFLLDYNGWFLKPKHPINKVWYLLMIALLGKKNLGAMNYQEYLPSLPVPSLGKTCKRYLDSVQPLLSEEDFEETKKAVILFEKKEGRKLQILLKLKAFFTRNWVHSWWLEYIYLRQRTPITFNSNYFGLTNKRPFSPHQLDRAAMCTYQAIKFYKSGICGKIENMTQFQGLVPFCMDGVKYLCNTARIPGKEVDKIAHHDPHTVNHIVVLRNRKFYKVQVLSSDGQLLPPIGIKKQLEKVFEMAGDDLDTRGVACLTNLDRPTWAQIRQQMMKDPNNRNSLHAIDSSYYIVALGREEPKDLNECGYHCFHGDGFNRWSDKSVTLCFAQNGHHYSNVEHSTLDATVCAQMSEFISSEEEYDENGHVPEGVTEFPVADPTELVWNLDGFEDDLEKAKDNMRKMIDDSDLLLFQSDYGKRIPKICKLSPDGWVQMCLQLAYYRMYGKLVQTYESATTRLYYKGRTETIRPVSMLSKNFVQAIDDCSIPREEVKQRLSDAIKFQEKYKFEAMRGLGIDRHLFGLFIIAKWLKMDPMPQMFQDKAFNLAFQLSTSQTPVRITSRWRPDRTSEAGGFGTVADDGYGVSYIVVGEDTVTFSVHSKRSCPTTSSSQFADAIRSAMNDMKVLYSKELGSC